MPIEGYHNIFYKIYDTNSQNYNFVAQTYDIVHDFKVGSLRLFNSHRVS